MLIRCQVIGILPHILLTKFWIKISSFASHFQRMIHFKMVKLFPWLLDKNQSIHPPERCLYSNWAPVRAGRYLWVRERPPSSRYTARQLTEAAKGMLLLLRRCRVLMLPQPVHHHIPQLEPTACSPATASADRRRLFSDVTGLFRRQRVTVVYWFLII